MTQPDDFLRRQPAVSHPSERIAVVRQPEVPSNNWAAWSIAFLPIGVVAISFGIGVLNGGMTWAVIWLVTAVLLALSVVLARVDRRELDAWGFEQTVSGWWVLLSPPVYLALRGNRVWRRTGAGLGPFWASVAAILLTPVGISGLGILGSVGAELQRVYAILGM